VLTLSKNAGFTAVYRKAFCSRYFDTPKSYLTTAAASGVLTAKNPEA